ncbi:MAG: hypothetical protein H0Z28_13600 [Archaeoglobus sp.]|nr:hypothetical protein [Archaeoglobus sp.]
MEEKIENGEDDVWIQNLQRKKEETLHLVKKETETYLATQLLGFESDNIQKDLGTIKLEDVAPVLIKFGAAAIRFWRSLEERSLFQGEIKERELLFRLLIEYRIRDFLSALIEEEFQERLKEVEEWKRENC